MGGGQEIFRIGEEIECFYDGCVMSASHLELLRLVTLRLDHDCEWRRRDNSTGMIRLLVWWSKVEVTLRLDWWTRADAKPRGGFRLTQNRRSGTLMVLARLFAPQSTDRN